MNARDILSRDAAPLSQKPRLGENFAWAVLDRKKPAANDCRVREKSEIKVRLASGKLFPGQYFDAETGLYQNYYRDYDPATGRYIESDPIGVLYGKNKPPIGKPLNHLYAYAGNNPIRFDDPLGLDYWVEGSVSTEGGHPFHQSVCVGQPSGSRLCISFGVAESDCLMGCKGEIYVDTSAAGPATDNYRKTSSSVDSQITSEFMGMIGKPGSYWLIGNNCRSFSQYMFDHLEFKYGGRDPSMPTAP